MENKLYRDTETGTVYNLDQMRGMYEYFLTHAADDPTAWTFQTWIMEVTGKNGSMEEVQELTDMERALLTLDAASQALDTRKDRSAWSKGVTVYALELLEGLREAVSGGYFSPDDLSAPKVLNKCLLNGASDWNQYSWGGCSLIYDPEIAARLCTPSELKRTRNGERNPNSRETWLDVQARALFQASSRVIQAVKGALL